MSFRFRYKAVRVGQPALALAGKRLGQPIRPRPLLVVTVVSPAGLSQPLEAILDTAADDTVFPTDLAAVLGIDLTQAPTRNAAGVGGIKFTLHYASVQLRLAGQHGQRLEWATNVAFSNARGQYPMLGYAGFLQFFDATFFGELEEVELRSNSAFPAAP